MIGLDTNLLVRVFAGDHPEQSRRAVALIDEDAREAKAYVSVIVLVEFSWTMMRVYRWPREWLLVALGRIADHPNLVVEDADSVREAMARSAGSGAEFPDQLIAVRNASAGCRVTATYDRNAARTPGFELLIA